MRSTPVKEWSTHRDSPNPSIGMNQSHHRLLCISWLGVLRRLYRCTRLRSWQPPLPCLRLLCTSATRAGLSASRETIRMQSSSKQHLHARELQQSPPSTGKTPSHVSQGLFSPNISIHHSSAHFPTFIQQVGYQTESIHACS